MNFWFQIGVIICWCCTNCFLFMALDEYHDRGKAERKHQKELEEIRWQKVAK